MGLSLTAKGWAAASPGSLPPKDRACGHACVACQGSELTPEWRAYMLLLFRIAELEAAIEHAHTPMLVTGLTAYRDRLIERRDAAWAELQ